MSPDYPLNMHIKASAHSFKQFTSRLLKLSFSLSMHLYTSDGRHAWFHLHGTSRPARSASEATKYKMKNSLSTVGLEPSTLIFQVWCSTDWASRAVHLNGLITYMYSQYQCLPCYKYQNDEVERNLSCKCTVLCYILEYILLKRSLESVARISLYYRLQTLADSEGVDRSRYNFQRMFPAWPSPISVKSNSF